MTADVVNVKRDIARVLGMSHEQVPDHVLSRIYDDELFLHHLMVCRHDEDLMKILLNGGRPAGETPDLPGNRELLATVARSVRNWARSNFENATPAEFQRRIRACDGCPNKVKPDKRLLYQVIAPQFVCSLCGCDIERKAGILTETCPDKHFGPHGRW